MKLYGVIEPSAMIGGQDTALAYFLDRNCASKLFAKFTPGQVRRHIAHITQSDIARGYVEETPERTRGKIFKSYNAYKKGLSLEEEFGEETIEAEDIYDEKDAWYDASKGIATITAWRVTKYLWDKEGEFKEVITVAYFLKKEDAKRAEREIYETDNRSCPEIYENRISQEEVNNKYKIKAGVKIPVCKNYAEYKAQCEKQAALEAVILAKNARQNLRFQQSDSLIK